ncbi:MAG: threonine ammonia-lyase [Promethearchaeota archaeon]
MAVDFGRISEALERNAGVVNETPVVTSRTLDRLVGARVFLKCENFQRMGAFKFRGAYNAISRLSPERRARGVVTHSSGNHAQAVALASRLLGVKAVVVMPENAPEVKVRATRDTYGAEVVRCASTLEARQETCARLVEEHGYTLVHPYDDDDVICGAGTAALELLRERPEIELVMAPVGGGGLLSGTAIAAKGFNPGSRVYGVEPELVDDAFRSFHSGRVETNERTDTVADGLRTTLSERTLRYIRGHVDGILLVTEREIVDAMRFLWERTKLVVEPSGAVPLAGLLSGKVETRGGGVGLILSGGNLDLGDFFSRFGTRMRRQ